MKKLIVALAAVAMGVVANAASFNWMVQSGYVYNGKGLAGSANRVSGTAYLFNVATYSQATLVSAFYANEIATIKDSALNVATLTGGRVADTTFDTTLTSNTDTYFAVFSDDGKSVYVSIAATSEYDGVMDRHSLAFGSVSDSSKQFASTTGGAYSSAGWYAVPEPTSGLLLLLGVAGLALKRKRT